jgi:pyruvate dehydrogenase E1 component beta subunit
LLKSAIRDPNPVVVIEHKALYQTTGPMPAEETLEPIGVAQVAREGGDVTLVSWSAMAGVCLEAAQELAAEGIEAEVIDLRTLLPADFDAVVKSVRKTGRLVVAHEAVTYCGFGAEVVAQLTERAWGDLKAPPVRVGSRFAPIPFAEPLESYVTAGKQEVMDRVRTCVKG